MPQGDIPATKRTLAILMTYTKNRTLQDAVESDLPDFLEESPEWCEKVTSFMCKRYGRTYEKFAESFPVFALDVCGITIWARCYRRQVGIVFNTSFWCTSRSQEIERCEIILV